MKWISVEDRLPEDNKLKVIRYSLNDRHIGIGLSRFYTPSNMSVKIWCFEFGSSQGTKVSHWMPLPNSPEVTP